MRQRIEVSAVLLAMFCQIWGCISCHFDNMGLAFELLDKIIAIDFEDKKRSG